MRYTPERLTEMISCAESKLAAASSVSQRKERFGLYALNESTWHILQLKLYLFILRRYRTAWSVKAIMTDEGMSSVFDRILRMPYPCDIVVPEVPPVIVNQPPIANAGVDQTLSIGAVSATLAGTGSDPDGDSLTVTWTKLSGGNATINTPSNLITSVTNLQTGTYVFKLTVTDSKGASTEDTVQIIIPAALDKFFYGRTSSALPSDPGALETLIKNSDWLNRNCALDVPIAWWVGQTIPQFCWVAIPNKTPDHNKNKWYVDVVNQGNIGSPTDLFGAPVTIMIDPNNDNNEIEYLLWISNYETIFSTNCLFKKV